MKHKQKTDRALYPDQPVVSTGIAGRCPRCGQGRIFRSALQPAESCSICGLDLKFAEVGDGPAVLVILLLGGVIAGLALAFENLFAPPVWLHVLVWLPVTVILSFWSLRAMKGIMIVSQYKTMVRDH